MNTSKRILVAPLNWGLGHSTRCIPIIKALLTHGHTPILASDGQALALLKQEFPELEAHELPSYNISYAKKGKHFKLKMVWDSPKILKAIRKEKKAIKELVKSLALDGIISDNRLGVRSKKVPSIFITHQLNVLTGNTTWMTSKAHKKIISKFTVCWVPDVRGDVNLSGRLGHPKKTKFPTFYLGPLSRFEPQEDSPIDHDLLVMISGPEPQRTLFEEKVMEGLPDYSGKVLLVRGVVEATQQVTHKTWGHAAITIHNYMTSLELQKAFASSKMVLSRSGYTTVMDLAKMGKKAFFVPTPGQYEQEYLAERFHKLGLAPYASQEHFSLDMLCTIDNYKGFPDFGNLEVDYGYLFEAFSKVKENSEPTPSSLST